MRNAIILFAALLLVVALFAASCGYGYGRGGGQVRVFSPDLSAVANDQAAVAYFGQTNQVQAQAQEQERPDNFGLALLLVAAVAFLAVQLFFK